MSEFYDPPFIGPAHYDKKLAEIAKQVERRNGVSMRHADSTPDTIETGKYYEGLAAFADQTEYHRMIGSMVVRIASVEYPVEVVESSACL